MRPISSGSVNAEWAGPRRAAITTSRTAEAAERCRVHDRRCRCGPGRPGSAVSTRATSRATLPLPMITTRSWLRSTGRSAEVGMPVDPRDQFGGGSGARQAHAVDVQATVVGRADRVQHGVMVGQQIGVAQVLADLDVEVEPEAAMTGDPVEEPGDPSWCSGDRAPPPRAPARKAWAASRRR